MRRGALALALFGVLVLVAVVLVAVSVRPTEIAGSAVAAGADTSSAEAPSVAPPPSRPSFEPDPGAANAKVGDCVKFDDRSLRSLARQVDCTAPDAVYEVGFRGDGVTTGTCPTQSYDQYMQTGPAGDFMLCLMMNGDKGDCFAGYSTSKEWKTKVDCAHADAEVTARLDGRVDPSVCPSTSRWRLLYPEPGRTLCLDPLR